MRNGAAKCTEMRWERAHGLQVQRERNACLHHRCLHQRGALQSNKVRCLCANKTIERSQRKIRHIGDRWMWLQLMWLQFEVVRSPVVRSPFVKRHDEGKHNEISKRAATPCRYTAHQVALTKRPFAQPCENSDSKEKRGFSDPRTPV